MFEIIRAIVVGFSSAVVSVAIAKSVNGNLLLALCLSVIINTFLASIFQIADNIRK